jgi:hypothetical protein
MNFTQRLGHFDDLVLAGTVLVPVSVLFTAALALELLHVPQAASGGALPAAPQGAAAAPRLAPDDAAAPAFAAAMAPAPMHHE